MRDQGIHIRHRQRLPVHLAVGSERQRLHLHKGHRDHVTGKAFLQGVTQLFGPGQFVFRLALCGCPVRHQPPVSRLILPRQHHGIPHPWQLAQPRLDLTQLYPEAPDLDLEVIPAQILEHPIGSPPAQVSRAIHPCTRLLTERIIHEPLCRQLHPIQVTPGHTSSAHVELSCHAQRHRLSLLIQNVDPCIGHRPSDRQTLPRVRCPLRFHPEHRRAHRRLGRPIGIDKASRTAPLLCQLRRAHVSAHRHRLQALEPLGLSQRTQRHRRQHRMRNPARLQQRPQRLARHQPFFRRQVQARTMQQRHHHFPDARIETKRGKLQHAARLVHAQLLLQQLRQIADT